VPSQGDSEFLADAPAAIDTLAALAGPDADTPLSLVWVDREHALDHRAEPLEGLLH
jgi:hypothetical protein